MKRTIRKGRGRSRHDVQHALEALFVAETISACPELWIVSPWLSDVDLIDNRGGRFEQLRGIGDRKIRLSEVLGYLAFRFETKVTVVVSDHEWASEIRSSLPRKFTEMGLSDKLNLLIKPQHELHEKSITTRDWQVSGSMNFTKQGIEIRDEVVEIEIDQTLIADSIIDLRVRYPWVSDG